MPDQSWPYSERPAVRWHDRIEWAVVLLLGLWLLFWCALAAVVINLLR